MFIKLVWQCLVVVGAAQPLAVVAAALLLVFLM